MSLTREEIIELLSDPGAGVELCRSANELRREVHGETVHLRAILEISNHCRGTCLYCGINCRMTDTERYRMNAADIRTSVERIVAAGFRTVILQAGEDPGLTPEFIAEIVDGIKRNYDVAATLSLGEQPREVYQYWRDAGADRYLLKLETADAELYNRLHPGMSFANRRRCLDDLFDLGYQVGSGNIVGLPDQGPAELAADILDFQEKPYDMIAVGPLIPAAGTPYAELPRPSRELVLRTLALARLAAPEAHIPSPTALCALDPSSRREALEWGANVLMIGFTPPEVGRKYRIYQRADCGSTANCLDCLRTALAEMNRQTANDKGSGFRNRNRSING